MQNHRNHHYVTQSHIKNFFNKEGTIYVYDKKRTYPGPNPYLHTTAKSLFSENDLNTRFVDGEIDYNSLENELNTFFETDFPKHYSTILEFVENRVLNENVGEAIYYMARYGIVGELRTPRFKKLLDDTIFGGLEKIFSDTTSELQKELEELKAFRKVTKYSNLNDYKEIVDDILERMGYLIFRISTPLNAEDYFLIPDCGSATVRDKINVYFNPDVKEVSFISLALSSKIYLRLYSSKIKDINPSSDVRVVDSDIVFKLNKANYDYCDSKVACENETYLKNFVASLE